MTVRKKTRSGIWHKVEFDFRLPDGKKLDPEKIDYALLAHALNPDLRDESYIYVDDIKLLSDVR